MEEAIAAVVCAIATVQPGDLWPALSGKNFMWLPITSITKVNSDLYEVLVIGIGRVLRVNIDASADVLIRRAKS